MMKKVFSWKIHLFVLALVCIAEFIGVRSFGIGIGIIALFPMLYALLIGSIISLPSLKLLSDKDMNIAANILGISFMLFVAKLGTMMGPSIPKLLDAGISLTFQEIGHFLGTIVFGLPVALLLGMKREAIGATFSIDREPNLAIIAEKYGADSPEGRGALGVYVCGTLFGAIYLSVIASLIASTGFFHPISLAMGAGVGSGSMMAAMTGALSVMFPDSANDIAVFAGAANLITTILGTFICVVFSLPVTNYLYKRLGPILGRHSRKPDDNMLDKIYTFAIIGIIAILGNWIGYDVSPIEALPSMAIIVAVTIIGFTFDKLVPFKIPVVIWVTIVALLISSSIFPGNSYITKATGQINFMALATPILAYAGLSFGKDLKEFKKLGWRIVVVSLVVYTGTFLFASLVAEIGFRLTGKFH
jgi:hypothetical protein